MHSNVILFQTYGICILFLLGIFVFNYSLESCTTIKAIKEIVSGEVKQYGLEYENRLNILLDDSIKNAELDPYTVQPDMLYVGDISTDPEAEANIRTAIFYGKESVCVVYPE